MEWGREDCRLSLLLVDLDDFKEINDTYGHEVGDRALVWLAEQLREEGGPHALPVRYAGDEFIVLMPQGGRPEAVELAERLHERSRQQVFRGPAGQEIQLCFSIGIATAPEHARDATSLIRRADAALYSAKAQGRGRHVVADAANLQQPVERTALHLLGGAEIAGRGRSSSGLPRAWSASLCGRVSSSSYAGVQVWARARSWKKSVRVSTRAPSARS